MNGAGLARDRIAAGTQLRALVGAMRPVQWSKNLLLVAAPLAAGVIGRRHEAELIAIGIIAFCLIASGGYLWNDVRDAADDRRHPLKRHRAVAAGVLPAGVALGASVVLSTAGLLLAAVLGWGFLACAVAYVAISAAYSQWLRDVAVMDVATVASLFILRAIAGGTAAAVPLSRWFLIVTSFGSLFVVAGKRYCERISLAADGVTRRTLVVYSPEYLRYVWMLASAVTVSAYCMWAFTRATSDEIPWFELSIIPFVLGVLRYALLIDLNVAHTPEETIASDTPLQLIAAVWLAVFVCGAYSAG